jgi:PAS domain S-box-containing protein
MISELKKHYIQALTEYVQKGFQEKGAHQHILKQITELRPEELISLHDASMRILVANVDTKDMLTYYHRSYLFMVEMVKRRARSRKEPYDTSVIKELRETLPSAQMSFEHVKNKYENILQYMDSGIALFDPNGFVSFVNITFSRLIGASRQSLLGHDIRGLLKNRTLSLTTRRLINRVYQEMYVYRIPFKELVDEKGRHLLLTATYDDELDGDFMISVKDVTEFKKIEQSAYHNDKLAMLGKIAASIAHEIRNPLTSIRGFIQLLKPDLTALGKQAYADIMLQEIDRANDIIYEFLNSSKPSAPDKKTIAVSTLVKDVSLLYDSEALLKGCSIETGDIDPSIVVSIDVKQIKQVLLNLVKNAMEELSRPEARRPGVIRLNASQSGGYVVITVEDNGDGIDEGILAKLFDPFFTTKEEGTGLGLAVSYRIIKNHGGRIQVKSIRNERTEFRIYLPVDSDSSAAGI